MFIDLQGLDNIVDLPPHFFSSCLAHWALILIDWSNSAGTGGIVTGLTIGWDLVVAMGYIILVQ